MLNCFSWRPDKKASHMTDVTSCSKAHKVNAVALYFFTIIRGSWPHFKWLTYQWTIYSLKNKLRFHYLDLLTLCLSLCHSHSHVSMVSLWLNSSTFGGSPDAANGFFVHGANVCPQVAICDTVPTMSLQRWSNGTSGGPPVGCGWSHVGNYHPVFTQQTQTGGPLLTSSVGRLKVNWLTHF